jgi:UDP-glucose 4-epimerase
MKKILVTGSSGTIGTRLCETLLSLGYQIVGIDKVANKWNEDVQSITIIKNLNDADCFIDLPEDISHVIHLAANPKVYASVADPSLAKENIDILYNTLEFCRNNCIKNFLFASSREVYGNNSKDKTEETMLDISLCESPYSSSKIAGEALTNSYQKCYDMNNVIFRFSTVYGMYDDSDRLVPLLIRLAKKNNDIFIFGEKKRLDFTYIDDTVSAIIKLLDDFPHKGTFNVSNGEAVFLVDIAKKIIEELNSGSKVIIKKNRVGEILHYSGDITKVSNLLDFNPKVSIKEGLLKAIEWYKLK